MFYAHKAFLNKIITYKKKIIIKKMLCITFIPNSISLITNPINLTRQKKKRKKKKKKPNPTPLLKINQTHHFLSALAEASVHLETVNSSRPQIPISSGINLTASISHSLFLSFAIWSPWGNFEEIPIWSRRREEEIPICAASVSKLNNFSLSLRLQF